MQSGSSSNQAGMGKYRVVGNQYLLVIGLAVIGSKDSTESMVGVLSYHLYICIVVVTFL